MKLVTSDLMQRFGAIMLKHKVMTSERLVKPKQRSSNIKQHSQ